MAGSGAIAPRGLRARLAARAWGNVKLLGDDKAAHRQLADLQPSDPRATDCQSADGKCAESYRAHRDGAQREPACCERPGCDGTQG